MLKTLKNRTGLFVVVSFVDRIVSFAVPQPDGGVLLAKNLQTLELTFGCCRVVNPKTREFFLKSETKTCWNSPDSRSSFDVLHVQLAVVFEQQFDGLRLAQS